VVMGVSPYLKLSLNRGQGQWLNMRMT
jgi:hypothetical protein